VSYFDAGYIAKFYVDEPDSHSVRRLAESVGEVHCASLGRVEVVAVIHRKMREGVFGESAFREIIAQFEDDRCRSPSLSDPPTRSTSPVRLRAASPKSTRVIAT
jgi:predicted nucleic acid-binding protein